MSKFDAFIKKLLEEGLGDMGPKVGAGGSSSPMGGSSGNSLSQPAKPAMGASVSPDGQEGGQLDIQNVLDDKTTQWKDWLTKPYNTQALNSHVMGTMFNPKADPQKRQSMLSTIDGNPDLKSYYTNLVNTFNTQQ